MIIATMIYVYMKYVCIVLRSCVIFGGEKYLEEVSYS